MALLVVRDLGRQPYEPVFMGMKAFTDSRNDGTADELWWVEHDPVFTQGQAGKEEHLLMPGDIPVVKVDRGGQVTYHGPGQIVGYPMVNLKRQGVGVREFVTIIETSLIDTLALHGITAYARSDAPGVYVARPDGGHLKIGSLGIRVRHGCTYHGLALNVDMDLSPFLRINPCGYQGLEMTQVKDLVAPGAMPTTAQLQDEILSSLIRQLGYAGSQAAARPTEILEGSL